MQRNQTSRSTQKAANPQKLGFNGRKAEFNKAIKEVKSQIKAAEEKIESLDKERSKLSSGNFEPGTRGDYDRQYIYTKKEDIDEKMRGWYDHIRDLRVKKNRLKEERDKSLFKRIFG